MQTPTDALLNSLDTVLQKSACDADFRQLALTDPLAALRASGAEVPAKARIRFVEELEELVVILPPFQPGGEISEQGLEAIQGGKHVAWTHLNYLVDRNDQGVKKTHEECIEDQKNATPGWLRGFLNGIFGA